jgi:hypothetical protein
LLSTDYVFYWLQNYKNILYNLGLYRKIAFQWLAFMIFCANDVFVNLFLCSKWDDDTNFHSRYRFARNNNEVSFERKNENTTTYQIDQTKEPMPDRKVSARSFWPCLIRCSYVDMGVGHMDWRFHPGSSFHTWLGIGADQ